MATQEKLGGSANFSGNCIGIVAPTYPGLLSWAYFGNASGDNTNLVSGGPTISAVGSPTTAAGYAQCSQTSGGANNCYDSGSGDLLTGTIIMCSRQGTTGPVAQHFGALGTWTVENSDVNHMHITGRPEGAGLPTSYTYSGSNPLNHWRIIAFSFTGASGAANFYDLTTQAGPIGTGVTNGSTTLGGDILLGGGGDNAAFNPVTQIAFEAIYNTALTQTQINALLPAIRFNLTARGVVEGS